MQKVKCIVCGYSSRKKSKFFKCWNKETRTGCKRYTCNNCIFIIRETTNYDNYICANTFCNEEHESERLVGLKKWFEPKKKIKYEEQVKILKKRESEIEKNLKKWEDAIAVTTKRSVFASKRASESEQFKRHFYHQIEFKMEWNGQESSYFHVPSELINSCLANVSVSLNDQLMEYQPRLTIATQDEGLKLLDVQLTSSQQQISLNYFLKTNYSLNFEIAYQKQHDYETAIRSSQEQFPNDTTVMISLEFIGGQ